MPRFINEQDFLFFNQINSELIKCIIDTKFVIYQVWPDLNKTNIYGETVDKTYYPGVEFYGYLNRQGTESDETELGTNVKQNLDIGVAIEDLLHCKVNPEIGDIIYWNGNYYEIHNTNENQYIAGQSAYSFSKILSCHLTNLTTINIGERRN